MKLIRQAFIAPSRSGRISWSAGRAAATWSGLSSEVDGLPIVGQDYAISVSSQIVGRKLGEGTESGDQARNMVSRRPVRRRDGSRRDRRRGRRDGLGVG